MFLAVPLALAADLQPRAVDDEVDGSVFRSVTEVDIELLTAARKSGVVGSFEVDADE